VDIYSTYDKEKIDTFFNETCKKDTCKTNTYEILSLLTTPTSECDLMTTLNKGTKYNYNVEGGEYFIRLNTGYLLALAFQGIQID